ncbi:MAG: hypothetical protein A3H29_08770 [Acidobacteria bacterium RIFCSPLOWO2_02_FULL_67_21]|nr:MAG: hypothetical protein A3H29_08770 [Acidobacteria bacterium RIFCSPLOWO2_02_FULL_67_21]
MAVDDTIPHTWNNERWVIDRLVDAVEAGDTDAKPKLGQRLLDGIGDDNWRSCRFIEDGFFVPFAALDPLNLLGEDLDSLCEERVISATREPLICDGAPLEGRELDRWREIVVDRAWAPECATFWMLIEVKHQRSRAVYVAAVIKPEYECEPRPAVTFVAAYATYSETLNALKARGFTGPKDYQTRAAEVLASSSADQGPRHARALPSTNRSSSSGSE